MASLGEAIANALGVTDARARADIIKFGGVVFDAIPADPIQSAFLYSAACNAEDSPGECMRRTGRTVGGLPEVEKVNITLYEKMPAKGILFAKSSATTCTIAYFGAYETGQTLIEDKTYFVGSDGRPTPVRPQGPAFIQIIGSALDASRLMINPNLQMVKVIG